MLQRSLQSEKATSKAKLDDLQKVCEQAGRDRDAQQAALERAQEQLEAKEAELQKLRSQLEGSRISEREEIVRLNRAHADREAAWRENLDWVKAAAAKSESDRLVSKRAARKARWEADTAVEARRALEAEVE